MCSHTIQFITPIVFIPSSTLGASTIVLKRHYNVLKNIYFVFQKNVSLPENTEPASLETMSFCD